MSFINRDILTPSVFAWNRCSSIYHRFKKVWTTSTIDGVEVYDTRLTYYSGGSVRTDKPFERFINALGVNKDDLQQDYSGIEKAYFWLNSKKYILELPSRQAIADEINFRLPVDDTFELQIYYTGDNERIVTDHFTLTDPLNPDSILSYAIDTTSITNTLLSNPKDLLTNSGSSVFTVPFISTVNDLNTGSSSVMLPTANTTSSINSVLPVTKVTFDTQTVNILSTIAVLDNGTTFENIGITQNPGTVQTLTSGTISYTYGFTVTYKVINPVTTTSYIVDQVLDVLQSMKDSMTTTKTLSPISRLNIAEKTTKVVDTSIKEAVMTLVDDPVDSTIIHQGHFTVDGLRLMKRKEFVDLLGNVFDTGYVEEKASFWEKVLAVVLIVVAVVVGVITGGASAIMSGELIAIATALAAASVTLALGQMLYMTAFPYATDMIRMIGKFAQIVGLLAMVTGIFAAIQNAFNTLAQKAGTKAAESAAKEGATKAMQQTLAEKAIQEYGLGDFIQDWFMEQFDTIASKITSVLDPNNFSVKSLSDITMKDISGWMDNLDTSLKMFQQFFGEKPKQWTAEDDQAVKEDGVEAWYASKAMLDEVDALSKVDFMVQGNNGGEKTERLLSKI